MLKEKNERCAGRKTTQSRTIKLLYGLIKMDKIIQFVKLLKAYQNKQIGLEEVVPKFKELDNFHDFWHYISDDDIRAKDQDYAAMQNKELDKFIAAIESGNYEQANKITFLGSTV
ncbi:hypothetical protein TK45_12855 [Bowmanella sp. JS7-9]|nr:hypothetical protein TK45_12855 [Bowmanella sp. JS7-9]